jgi:hypothetical protein
LQTVSSTTTAFLSTPPALPQTGTFVIYRTNLGKLPGEIVRTNSYLAVSPYCSSSLIGNMLVHQRTWDFPQEVGTVAYMEMGVGWSGTALADHTMFARFLLHSVTTVNAGEQLRLIYQLRVIMEPYDTLPKTAAITNWPILPSTLLTGNERVQLMGMSSVSSIGTTSSFDTGGQSNEPSVTANVGIFLSDNAAAPAAFGSCVDRYTAASHAFANVSAPSYTSFSFTRIKQITFTSGQAIGSSWYSMGVGNSSISQPGKFNTVIFVFTQPQTKLTAHTLNLQYFFTWSRVLAPSSV